MNLITELHPFFKKIDNLLSEEEVNNYYDTPFQELSKHLVPNSILLEKKLNILLDCAGIRTYETKLLFLTEMYFLYLKGCFK